jgi:hypothetical protein
MPIRRVFQFVAAVGILVSASCGDNPGNDSQKPANKFKVEYFWSSFSNPYGYASVKAGVRAALDAVNNDDKDNPGGFRLLEYVQFEDREDPDSQDKADRLAREIRRDPDVLAVIGHAASGTTFAALPRYAEAGIPVLITSATSPYLLYRHSFDAHVPNTNLADADYSTPRYTNAFRLIPSDVPDQAHAMELAIKQLSETYPSTSRTGKKPDEDEGSKVLLICDATKDSGAEIYSKPICDYLAAPVNRKEGKYNVVGRTDIDKSRVSSILAEIHAVKPDFIVVASYSALARLVLQVWTEDKEKQAASERSRSSTSSAEKSPEIRFIMPDACLSRDLLEFDAPIYVTYPVSPAHINKCASIDRYRKGIACQKEKQLNKSLADCEDPKRSDQQPSPSRAAESKAEPSRSQPSIPDPLGIPETDEMFGYDSVLILKEAVKSCVAEHDLDRPCILRYLNEHHGGLKGVCETYRVERGDRQNAYYYVYENVKKNDKPRTWEVQEFAKADDYELNRTASTVS